eukprot:SAG22_NODE_1602_length_4021_cov_10.186130_2_plen_271_part_00
MEVIQNLVKVQQEAQLHQEQARYMRAQMAAKDLQVEQERARVDVAVHQERERSFSKELDARRATAADQSMKQMDAQRVSREQGPATTQKQRAESMSRIRQRQQQTRLAAMHTGSELAKHHLGKVKSEVRFLMLSADDSSLSYAKDRRSISKGKRILVSDIRGINFGFETDNLGLNHFEHITTPEWFCFSIVLDERTVDFSCRTEAETVQWVLGLRTLCQWNKQDYRGLEVGAFFWQRAAMKLRVFAVAADKTRYRHLIDVVKSAGQKWDR